MIFGTVLNLVESFHVDLGFKHNAFLRPFQPSCLASGVLVGSSDSGVIPDRTFFDLCLDEQNEVVDKEIEEILK